MTSVFSLSKAERAAEWEKIKKKKSLRLLWSIKVTAKCNFSGNHNNNNLFISFFTHSKNENLFHKNANESKQVVSPEIEQQKYSQE
jgi:hypothetical protein